MSKLDGFCGALTGGDFSGSCAPNVGGPINGTMLKLTKETTNAVSTLKSLVSTKLGDWMEMKKSGEVLYFGKPRRDYQQTDGLTFLANVLLASKKEVTKIPGRNDGYQGMAIREVRDIPAETIRMVRQTPWK